MGRKDKSKDTLNRDDILNLINDAEKKFGQKLDEASQEAIVRAVNGVIGIDQVTLELKLRADGSEYIINRTPSSGLAECLSWVSVAVLRDLLDFIIHVVEESVPPDAYLAAVLGTRKKPKDMHDIIVKAKEVYTADIKTRKKKNLAADAYQLLSDRNVAKRIMLGMGPESRKAYDEAVKGGSNYSFYAVTNGLMYVFGGKKSEGYSPLVYIVPDELKDCWLSLPETEIKQSDTAANYAAAAANLYGAITGIEVFELIRRYDTAEDSGPVSLASMSGTEIVSAVNLRTFDDECSYQLYSDDNSDDIYIISNNYREYLDNKLPGNDGHTYYFNDENSDKPRYFPSKSEFLRYTDPEYYEHTPEIDALRLYIQTKHGKQIAKFLRYLNKEHMAGFEPVTQDEELDYIMEELHNVFASEGSDFEEMTDILGVRNIDLGGPGEVNELFKYISAARDNTRTWYNKGNLPDNSLSVSDTQFNGLSEVEEGMNILKRQIYGSIYDSDDTDEDDAKILPMPDLVTTDKAIPFKVAVKPGRNDPCPCGSGKKYKKCCGR